MAISNPITLNINFMSTIYVYYYSQRQFSKRISDINFMVQRINLRLIKEIQILSCTKGGQINVINPVTR